ncbi:hypothetical protein FACS1894214_5160 [Planctomycetales bacterium]|nr:hypothetical protein FACS1894214_5160 [Planctomycetales bacterium]
MTLHDYFRQRTADGTFIAVTEFESRKRVIFRGEVCSPEQIIEYQIDLPEGRSIRIESSLGSRPIFTVHGIDSDPQTFFDTRFHTEEVDRYVATLQKQG